VLENIFRRELVGGDRWSGASGCDSGFGGGLLGGEDLLVFWELADDGSSTGVVGEVVLWW